MLSRQEELRTIRARKGITMHAKYRSLAFALVFFWCAEARAGYLYTYITNPSNPLNSKVASVQDFNDQLTVSFAVSFRLDANSTYDISANPSAQSVQLWFGGDSKLHLAASGYGAPIQLVPGSGLINGGPLDCALGQACFGGAVMTNAAGQITAWNLVADSADSGYPQLSIISYSTPLLGSLDALSYTVGHHSPENLFAENTLNGPVGSWIETPEPESIWLMLGGLGCLGLVTCRRHGMRKRV
jgi:hypothetical protein